MARTKNYNKNPNAKNFLYYLNWKSVAGEIANYGYELSLKKALTVYIVFFAGMFIIAKLFSLGTVSMIIIAVAGILALPRILINSYKNMYEQKRFEEVSQYMEQMLYSFRGSSKILVSLNDVKPLFIDGPMYEAISKAEDVFEKGDVDNVEEVALQNIENEYRCDRLRTMHRFMMKVERLGGDYNDAIQLLINDRAQWVVRTAGFQKEKNRLRRSTIVSIIMATVICYIMQNINTQILPSFDKLPVIQLVSTFLLVGDIILYTVVDKRLAIDWLDNKQRYSDSEIEKMYDYVQNYDESREKKKMIKMMVLPIIVAILGVLSKDKIFLIVAVIVAAMVYTHSKRKYSKTVKALQREIRIAFPRWLMELTLHLQTQPVQVSIFMSIATAPAILKPELIKLKEQLEENPNSMQPYTDFLGDFRMADIRSTMKMLYSIQLGNTDEEKEGEQIIDLITRNNTMLDEAEKLRNEDALAGMLALELTPQLLSSVHLVVSLMMLLMMVFTTIQV